MDKETPTWEIAPDDMPMNYIPGNESFPGDYMNPVVTFIRYPGEDIYVQIHNPQKALLVSLIATISELVMNPHTGEIYHIDYFSDGPPSWADKSTW